MINHNQPCLGKEENLIIKKIILSGKLSEGQEVLKFENDLCNFFNLPKGHAAVVSSGSAALFLALSVLNSKNKNVGFPVYSCSSLRNAVGMVGARSIYLDCETGTPNVNIKQAEKEGRYSNCTIYVWYTSKSSQKKL